MADQVERCAQRISRTAIRVGTGILSEKTSSIGSAKNLASFSGMKRHRLIREAHQADWENEPSSSLRRYQKPRSRPDLVNSRPFPSLDSRGDSHKPSPNGDRSIGCRCLEPQQGNLGGYKGGVEKLITSAALRPIVRPIVQFENGYDLGRAGIAEDNVRMMASHHEAKPVIPGSGWAIDQVGDTDLDGDEIAIGNGRLQGSEKGEFATAEKWSAWSVWKRSSSRRALGRFRAVDSSHEWVMGDRNYGVATKIARSFPTGHGLRETFVKINGQRANRRRIAALPDRRPQSDRSHRSRPYSKDRPGRARPLRRESR